MKFISIALFSLSILIFISCDSVLESESLDNADCILTRSELNNSSDNHTLFPFEITVMQERFDNYLEMKTDNENNTVSKKLSPTHHALKLDVSDIEVVHRIERDSSLIVSYIPFGATIDAKYDASELLNPTKQSFGTFTIYSSDSINECSTYSVEKDSLQICPLYVLWPVDKKLPSSIKYEICYDAFIPEKAIRSNSANTTYQKWLIEEMHGQQRSQIGGYIYAYDNSLGQNVPVRNAKIQISGYRINFIYTDAEGHFYLPEWGNIQNASLTLWLDNNIIIIRDGTTSNQKTIPLGSVSSLWGNNTNVNIYLPDSFEMNIFQAAGYYSYGQNTLLDLITRYYPIDIHAIDSYTSGQDYGNFYYSTQWTPYIYIRNYNPLASNIFGTVLHELGHATYYGIEGYNMTNSVPDVIQESYASFFGWYNALCYYSYVGANHSFVHSICTQGRQAWTPNSVNLNYTPIYIDLFDNINQMSAYNNTSYVDDSISGLPVSAILSAAMGPTSFSQVVSILSGYVGVYYNQSSYDNYITNYLLANF